MMIKLVAASATLLTLAAVGSGPARAWCDEDCAYEAHEAAYERAEAHEYAREEAEENGYGAGDRGAGRLSSREQSPRQERTGREEAKRAAPASRIAQPQPAPAAPAPATPAPSPRSKAASENSSIATGSTQIAVDDNFDRPRRQLEVGCKTFFAASGMTLTVPCD